MCVRHRLNHKDERGQAAEELDRSAISDRTERDPYTRALFEANAHEAR